jgi:GNAT superfamily N-acetyltransferase
MMGENALKDTKAVHRGTTGVPSDVATMRAPSGMVQVPLAEMGQLEPLFRGTDDTMVLSCLQGFMGKAWVDRLPGPTCARVIVGDICFLAGEPTEALVAGIFKDHPVPSILCVPESEEWAQLIERCFPGRFNRFNRYAFQKDPAAFSREKLHRFVEALPEGYSLTPLGGDLVETVARQEWSRDFVSNFVDAADYLKRGIGWVVLHAEVPVCGASSYTVYRGGIEIQIDTRVDHRRKGLARACAASLILDCLDRGLYPSWDAANLESVALADQLGYQRSHAYVTYEVNRPDVAEKRI